MGNGKPQTAKYHVTTALRSRLQFAVHVWTAGRASSGKWFTARFFATKNCTASRLKVWTSFLHPFAMCLLNFWSRINELLLIFGRLKLCTSTWWKQHCGPKQWTRSSNQFYIPFCLANKENVFCSNPEVFFFSILLLNSYLNSVSVWFLFLTYHSANIILFCLFLLDWRAQAS